MAYCRPQLSWSPDFPGSVATGGQVTVNVWDINRRSQSVVVVVKDILGGQFEVEVSLDAKGCGEAAGTVPAGLTPGVLSLTYQGEAFGPIFFTG